MEYKFVTYSPPHLKSLVHLIDHAFGIDNPDKKGMVVWKYFDPYLANKTTTYLALTETDEVVGHYVSFPITVLRGKKEYQATLSTDIATRKDHRGKGLISRLAKMTYDDIRKKGYDFSFGYANDAGVKVDKNSKTYGYHLVDKFIRYFRVVLIRQKTPYHLEKTSTFSKEITFSTSSHYRLKKDRAYLNWRYFKKPSSEYTVYNLLEGKDHIGYVVLRFSGRKVYVHDIVVGTDEKSVMSNVLTSIENEALRKKVRLVIYSVLDNSYWQSLFGKFRYLKKTRSKNNYYLSVHKHNQKLSDELFDKDSWLLMNGDIL